LSVGAPSEDVFKKLKGKKMTTVMDRVQVSAGTQKGGKNKEGSDKGLENNPRAAGLDIKTTSGGDLKKRVERKKGTSSP